MAFYIGGGIGHKPIGLRPIGGGRYPLGVTGNVVQTAPSFNQSITAAIVPDTIVATIGQQAPSFTQSITAQWYEGHEATLDMSAPAFNQSITGVLVEYEVTATLDQTAPAFSQSAEGIILEYNVATVAQTAPSFSQSIDALWYEGHEGTIAQTLPTFTQSITGALANKTVTGTIDNIRFGFFQRATDQANPPRVASMQQEAPSFETNITAATPADNITGTMANSMPPLSTKVYVDIWKISTLIGDHFAPNFSQLAEARLEVSLSLGQVTQAAPSFTQSIDGTAGAAVSSAIIDQTAPVFSQKVDAALAADTATGIISGDLPTFTQNIDGTVENSVRSAILTQIAPGFFQSIDAQYVISSKNALISQVLPPFSQNVRVTLGNRIRQEAPGFFQYAAGLRQTNLNEVVEPLTVTTLGTLVDDDPISDTWVVDKAIYIDKPTQITMDISTEPYVIDIRTVRRVNLAQKTTADIRQTTRMNYVSNNIA